MAKKKENLEEQPKVLENDFYRSFSKEIGGELLSDLDNCVGFIDLGNLAVNYICSGKFVGGGLPIGAMAEISGESASGKSVVATNFLKGSQKINGVSVMHDAEHAISKDFAIKASKVNPEKLIVTRSTTLEGSFNKIQNIIRQARDDAKIPLDRPINIAYDSIASSASEREYAQTTLDMETATQAQIKESGAGVEKPGERARVCSSELRKLMPIVKERNATVLFVNQLRKAIGVMWGDDEVEAGGGKALKYYASTRLRMYAYKKIKDSRDRFIGINVTFKNTKSRFVSPFLEARNVRLLFDKGIDPFGGLLELMLQIDRVIPEKGAGMYRVAEPWSDGKEVKFRTTKESNVIPWETLLECPRLVDAESAEQIQYYVDLFDQAAKENLVEEEFKKGEVA